MDFRIIKYFLNDLLVCDLLLFWLIVLVNKVIYGLHDEDRFILVIEFIGHYNDNIKILILINFYSLICLQKIQRSNPNLHSKSNPCSNHVICLFQLMSPLRLSPTIATNTKNTTSNRLKFSFNKSTNSNSKIRIYATPCSSCSKAKTLKS